MAESRPSGRVELKATQRRVLAALEAEGSSYVTRKRYEELAGVSRSQAAYDLAELVEAGVLERLGEGRATRYRIARRSTLPRRRWTNDRIREALEEFCGGREEWPSASEFKAAGRADLYVAASRYGGIGHWAVELGFGRPARVAPPAPVPLRRARPARVRLLLAAALLAGVVAAAGGALQTLKRLPAAPTTAPQDSAHEAAPAKLARPTPKARASTKQARTKQARPTTARPKRTVRQRAPNTAAATSEPTAQLASATSAAPARSTTATSTSTATATRTTASSGGPRPLPPPSTGGPPEPLPPPR